jgi:hypothetical protein
VPDVRRRRREPARSGTVLQFFADAGGHDESRMQEAAHLLMEWTKECMAAHGWYLKDAPPEQP